MKKLTVLVAVILIAGLLAGCGIIPGSRLYYIEVEPDDFTLHLGSDPTKQLEVTATYDDLTIADVTLECEYTWKPEALTKVVATVSDEGLVTGMLVGNTDILVSYTQRNFWTGDITRITEVEVRVRK